MPTRKSVGFHLKSEREREGVFLPLLLSLSNYSPVNFNSWVASLYLRLSAGGERGGGGKIDLWVQKCPRTTQKGQTRDRTLMDFFCEEGERILLLFIVLQIKFRLPSFPFHFVSKAGQESVGRGSPLQEREMGGGGEIQKMSWRSNE